MAKRDLIYPSDAPQQGYYRHHKYVNEPANNTNDIYYVVGVGPHPDEDVDAYVVFYLPIYESDVYRQNMYDMRRLHTDDKDGFLDPLSDGKPRYVKLNGEDKYLMHCLEKKRKELYGKELHFPYI